VDDSVASQTTSWSGLLDRLWRTLARSRLTVILLVWMAVVLVLSAVVPQAPSHIDDPIVRSQWLASVPTSFRPVVERLQPFGVFSLLDSVWLRLPLALMLAHALVVLADWSPTIWNRVRRQLDGDGYPGRSFRLDLDWPEPVEVTLQQVVSRLEKAGCRILPGHGQEALVAWRWRWSWLGLAGIYLGLGLASAGLILDGWLGPIYDVKLGPASPVTLPAAGTPSLALDEVTVGGDDPMRPVVGKAWLRILTGAGESQKVAIRLHGSRLFRGMWVTLVDLRPVAEVVALDAETGESILLQPFSPRTPTQERVRLPLTGDPETRFVGVPSKEMILRVDYRADQDHHPDSVFSLAFFHGSDVRSARSLSLGDGAEMAFEGVRYRLTFDYDAVLRVNGALWWIMVGVGWGLGVLSFILLAVAPPVYVQGQVKAQKGGSRISLTVDMVGDQQRLRRELGAPVAPEV